MCCRAKRSIEEDFPHKNWAIIISFQLLISTIFSVMSASIYQFVTSPRTLPDKLSNDEDESRYWPGLGGTDTEYAWVQAAQPLFETGAVPVTVAAAYRLPYSFLLYIFACLAGVGGGVYALAPNVWVAFLGRGLMGAGVQFGAATIHTYLGEMGSLMDKMREKQGKKPRKFILYLVFSFVLNGGFTLPFVLTFVMAKFRDVDPYRWPGWVVTSLATLLGLVVLLFFRETRSLSGAKLSIGTCSCLAGLKLSAQLRSKSKMRFLKYFFVISCGYTIGKVYAILLTLVTPILNNKFGFSVEHTAAFLIGLSAALLSSSFLQLGAKIAKINNRILLGVCLLQVLCGSVLVGDWQSIGYKNQCHCDNMSLVDGDWNGSLTELSDPPCYLTYCGDNSSLIDSGNGVLNCSESQSCESRSGAGHHCYWNPQSPITGEFCNNCVPECLSKKATINFYQFSAGILLLSVAGPLGFVIVSAVASEITSVESQGAILSLLVGTGAFSRAVSPIWFVKSYDLTGRHTYIAMAITAGCAAVQLLSLAALYRNLAPIATEMDEDAVVKATSKLSAVVEDDHELEGNNQTTALDVWTETPC